MQRNNGYIGGKVLNNAGGVQDLYDRYVRSYDINQSSNDFRSPGLSPELLSLSGENTNTGFYELYPYTTGNITYYYMDYTQGISVGAISDENVAFLKRKTVRLVFHYVSGSSYRGDWQIGWICVGDRSTFLPASGSIDVWGNYGTSGSDHPEPQATSYHFHDNEGLTDWQRTSQPASSNYGSASWETMTEAVLGSGDRGKWVKTQSTAANPTPSNYTGTEFPNRGDYQTNGAAFLFAEVTGNNVGYPNKNFWLRSKPIYMGEDPVIKWFNGRYGANLGTLKVYVDVVRGAGLIE